MIRKANLLSNELDYRDENDSYFKCRTPCTNKAKIPCNGRFLVTREGIYI